jgi:hypothetical protein
MVQRSEAKGDIYSTPDRRRQRGLRGGTVVLSKGTAYHETWRKWRCRRVSGHTGGAPHLCVRAGSDDTKTTLPHRSRWVGHMRGTPPCHLMWCAEASRSDDTWPGRSAAGLRAGARFLLSIGKPVGSLVWSLSLIRRCWLRNCHSVGEDGCWGWSSGWSR